MLINVLIRSIKVGLRSRIAVCGITLLAGYCYWYGGNPLVRLTAIMVFVVSVEIMIFLWGSSFAEDLSVSLKMLFTRKKGIHWKDMPEFKKIAEKMGVKLHNKHPFGIMKGLNNAYSIPLTKQIIFGDVLLKKLGKQERLALAAHELTHIKQEHSFRHFPAFVLVVSVISLSLSLSPGPSIVSNLISVAALIIAFVFVNWKSEFDADSGAAIQVGARATTSLLDCIGSTGKKTQESETHPSINSRISRIRAKYSSK